MFGRVANVCTESQFRRRVDVLLDLGTGALGESSVVFQPIFEVIAVLEKAVDVIEQIVDWAIKLTAIVDSFHPLEVSTYSLKLFQMFNHPALSLLPSGALVVENGISAAANLTDVSQICKRRT